MEEKILRTIRVSKAEFDASKQIREMHACIHVWLVGCNPPIDGILSCAPIRVHDHVERNVKTCDKRLKARICLVESSKEDYVEN